jgi:hypothetical protein
MASIFETKTCSRCGGSGSYSYCQMYGSTCFGCSGSGRQLTKRGKAAAAFLRSLRTVKASAVNFGDAVLIEGCPGFSKTTYIRVDEMHTQLRSGSSRQPDGTRKTYNHLFLEGSTPKGERSGLGTFPDADVRLVPTKAQAAAQIAQALAYQATLTQAGKPRQRAA